MQYELILTGKFKKSLKLAKKRGLDLRRFCFSGNMNQIPILILLAKNEKKKKMANRKNEANRE